jgi:hypothetical protein
VTLHRLLGFDVDVPDPDGLVAFYGELGLAGDAARGFTGTDGGATVVLGDGPFRRLRTVRIGCRQESDLDGIAARLRDGGAEVGRTPTQLTVEDPVTRVRFTVEAAAPAPVQSPPALVVPNAPGAVVRSSRRAPAVTGAPRPPRRLGHLVIGSPDVERTASLLVDGLGLRRSDAIPGIMHFLRCSTDHHNVAVVDSPVPLLQHYSFECDDIDHLGHTATALVRADPTRHAWGLGRHFAGSNFYWYLSDPSGAFLELYSDLDQILDDEDWEREGRTEFAVERIANAWGPDLPLEFVVPGDLDALQHGWDALR